MLAPPNGVKASIRSPHMLAGVALVDPVLTLSCPPGMTASSGLDALTQCLEPYVSPRANPATDAFAAEGLGAAPARSGTAYETATTPRPARRWRWQPLRRHRPRQRQARGGARLRGRDRRHDRRAARRDLRRLLAPIVEANLRALRERAGSPALHRYAEIARILTGATTPRSRTASRWLRETVAALASRHSAPSASAGGVRRGRRKAERSSSMQGNPVVLSQDELLAVLDDAS